MRLTIISAAVLLMIAGCAKKDDRLIMPLAAGSFPQVIKFDDEGDGDLEDEDKFSFKLTLNDKVDPGNEELGGAIIPLTSDVTVQFELKDMQGLSNAADYIKDIKAFYEIDDCTTSEDMNIDLRPKFDVASGKGSVTFPKGVSEIEIEFETDEDLFDDDVLNKEERSLSFILTGVTGAANVTYNPDKEFKYEVLDDEGIHGDWELDHEDAEAFTEFKKLFSMLNEDIKDLDADDVDKIEISVEYDEVKVVIELKEKETVTECGETEEVNKVIEIEADLEALSTLTEEGEMEVTGEIEQEDKSVKEFTYKGNFKIEGEELKLVLSGEYDDNETDEITLHLKK